MVNVFTLGIIFTSLELADYLITLITLAIEVKLETRTFVELVSENVYIVIAIVWFILELIGTRKKHYGLSLFSVVFRSIQVICLIIYAIKEIYYMIIDLKNMPNEDIDDFLRLTRKDKKIELIFTAVSFDECKV